MRAVLPLLCTVLLAAGAAPASAQTECWIKRDDASARRSAKHAPLLKAALAGEELIRKNTAFSATPVPVRMGTEVDAGDWGGSVWITAFPERTAYSKVWVPGKCEVFPASDTLGAGIGKIGIFFNNSVQEPFLMGHEVPKFEGTVGGYPVYNGRVVLTRDKRLPWIPQTLADRLDREQAAREKKLADFRRQVAAMKLPDAAQVKQSYEMMRKNDQGAADRFQASMNRTSSELARQQQDVYPAMLRQMESSVAAVKRYRSTFDAAQLAAPARWVDGDGAERKKLDARARELRPLSPADKAALDSARLENRALSGKLQEALKANKAAEAAALRGQIAEQTADLAGVQKRHDEQVAIKVLEMTDEYTLANLKPGDRESAMGWKADPYFQDTKEHSRIVLITVAFSPKGQDQGRGPWMKAAADSFDFASLAALLK